MTFYFNHPRDTDARSRGQKVGSLKDFELCGIPEKEPWHNRQKVINPFDHLPEVKRKFWHECPIVLSTEVPDQHLSESASDQKFCRSKISQVASYIDIRRRSTVIECLDKLRPMKPKGCSRPV
jgi:hypothetical protein